MLGRGSTHTVDRTKGGASELGGTVSEFAAEAGSRAAETMGELAERAADLAGRAAQRAADAAVEARRSAEPMLRNAAEKAAERAVEARKNAEPVLRSAAEKAAANLSEAAEKAAEVLAETAERLATQGAEKGAEVGEAAGKKLTKASKHLGKAAKGRKSHRRRNVLIIGGAIGGAVAVALSPLGARLRARITGQQQEEIEEPQSITLPVQPATGAASREQAASAKSSDGKPSSSQQGDGNGVLAGRPLPPQGEEQAKGS